jgi:hypothetical protein
MKGWSPSRNSPRVLGTVLDDPNGDCLPLFRRLNHISMSPCNAMYIALGTGPKAAGRRTTGQVLTLRMLISHILHLRLEVKRLICYCLGENLPRPCWNGCSLDLRATVQVMTNLHPSAGQLTNILQKLVSAASAEQSIWLILHFREQ